MYKKRGNPQKEDAPLINLFQEFELLFNVDAVFARSESCRIFFSFACEVVDETVASLWSVCGVFNFSRVFAKVKHYDYWLLVFAARENV